MKVLDLYRGTGGWGVPFIEDGDDYLGIDIKDHAHDGRTMVGDIREIDGYGFWDMDLIIGSPPCTEFSIAKELTIVKGGKRDVEKGLELVHEFERFIDQAKPQFWAMENVAQLSKWYPKPASWNFWMSAGGRRRLWTNFSLPLAPDYHPQRVMGISRETYEKHNLKRRLTVAERGRIPYPIARFVADVVKAKVSTYKSESSGPEK